MAEIKAPELSTTATASGEPILFSNLDTKTIISRTTDDPFDYDYETCSDVIREKLIKELRVRFMDADSTLKCQVVKGKVDEKSSPRHALIVSRLLIDGLVYYCVLCPLDTKKNACAPYWIGGVIHSYIYNNEFAVNAIRCNVNAIYDNFPDFVDRHRKDHYQSEYLVKAVLGHFNTSEKLVKQNL